MDSKTLKRLLRFARSVVRSVSSQVKQQQNTINDNVVNQIQQMVQSTVNGIWRGNGADEFVREMTEDVLPDFGIFMTVVDNTNQHIENAINIMESADQNATGKVNSLVDLFRAIY